MAIHDLHAKALTAYKAGDFEQAESYCRQALGDDPAHAPSLELLDLLAKAYYNRGNACRTQGLVAKAAECYQHAVRLGPKLDQAYTNLGALLADHGQPVEAIQCYRQALALKPHSGYAYYNLGNVLKDQGLLAEAIECYRQALSAEPLMAEAHLNLSVVLMHSGQVPEAVREIDMALAQKPNYAPSLWQRAHLRLLMGDFANGWLDYEQRWAAGTLQPRTFAQPRWDGSSLEGKTILVHAEQGLGDTIQFVRYLPLVKARGATVLFQCQPALLVLCVTAKGADQIFADGDVLPPFDVQVPLLSLPGIFGTTLATISAEVPYLHADPRFVDQWKQKTAQIDGFKVGIVWQGDPRNSRDRYRSVPLSQFETLAGVDGVRLISLQVDPGMEQLSRANFPVTLGFNAGTLDDLAAVLVNLDLVISIESAVAHLAGALGVPVWVPLPVTPDWRWLLERDDSPWYPTMRLFRQERFGDWAGVFDKMKILLHRWPNAQHRRK